MIGPARRAEKHARARVHRGKELESEPQRTTAARRLNAGDPLVVRMLAEQDRPDQLGKALVTGAPQIAFALLRFLEDHLGLLDHLEHRRAPRAVAEHADSDIDLVRPRIGIGERNEDEQRVALDGR